MGRIGSTLRVQKQPNRLGESMNLIELKAKAYDLIATIEKAQSELKETNQKILEAMQAPKSEDTSLARE